MYKHDIMEDSGLRWNQYLSDEDCYYLIQYVENVKNGISNDKMVILSGVNDIGIYTIKKDIKTYLGGDLVGMQLKVEDILSSDTIRKLLFITEMDDICTHTLFSYKKRMNQSLINLIKYKQSFIAITGDHKKVNSKLKEHCRILQVKKV